MIHLDSFNTISSWFLSFSHKNLPLAKHITEQMKITRYHLLANSQFFFFNVFNQLPLLVNYYFLLYLYFNFIEYLFFPDIICPERNSFRTISSYFTFPLIGFAKWRTTNEYSILKISCFALRCAGTCRRMHGIQQFLIHGHGLTNPAIMLIRQVYLWRPTANIPSVPNAKCFGRYKSTSDFNASATSDLHLPSIFLTSSLE